MSESSLVFHQLKYLVRLLKQSAIVSPMRLSGWRLAKFSLVLTTAWPFARLEAEEASKRLYPSFYTDAIMGLTTAKSKMVESNDAGTSLRYGIGAYAFPSRSLEFQIGFETDQASFALNESKTVYEWQDTKALYHWKFLYLGAVFSRLGLTLNREGEDVVDAAGFGYGGGGGMMFEIGNHGSFKLDLTQVSISEMKNELAEKVAIKSRLDIDLGASIDIWGRWLELNFGYRTRALSISLDQSYAESISSTYIGLRASISR